MLKRLMVGNTSANTRFSFYSASQSYNGLDDVQQKIVKNFKDALALRGVFPRRDYLTDVERGPPLGEGAFSNVYKGLWKGNEVAVKRFRPVRPPDHIKGTLKEKFMDHVEPLVSFYRELVFWKIVSGSSSVWGLLGFTMWLDREKTIVVFALVSPLAEGHLKLNYFEWYSLKPKEFANYFHDAATGLQSLHDHDVIHGDIRPENILKNKGRCYLVDFGISKLRDSPSSGSFSFAAVVTSDGSVTRTKDTDVFSFGSTMYQVLAWKTLDNATGPLDRPERRLGQEWDAIWNLILRCMSDDRPTTVELVEILKVICRQ
ncbi:kinase-like domain-containing protein [Russula emetica]|nr:kinase-like domain-containing protein [Russula emetica]